MSSKCKNLSYNDTNWAGNEARRKQLGLILGPGPQKINAAMTKSF
jgi:hypothetical protein